MNNGRELLDGCSPIKPCRSKVTIPSWFRVSSGHVMLTVVGDPPPHQLALRPFIVDGGPPADALPSWALSDSQLITASPWIVSKLEPISFCSSFQLLSLFSYQAGNPKCNLKRLWKEIWPLMFSSGSCELLVWKITMICLIYLSSMKHQWIASCCRALLVGFDSCAAVMYVVRQLPTGP